MSELDLIKQQINQKTDQSLESTRRMVQMTEESHQLGTGALEQLYHQGEQIDNVNRQMDTIHQGIKQTEQELDNLEKCCGLFVLPWKRVKRPGNEKHFKSKDYNAPPNGHSFGFRKNHSDNRVIGGDVNVATRQAGSNQGGFITRITNDSREDEMDKNLGQVSHTVGELRSMALEMNNEVAIHNRKLDDIARKADDNKVRLNVAQNQAERIVGKPTKPSNDTSFIPSPGIGTVSKHIASQAFK